MNRIVKYLFALLAFLPISAYADYEKSYEYHYTDEDFSIKKKGDMVMVVPSFQLMEDCFFDFDLPYLPILWYDIDRIIDSKNYTFSLSMETSEKILVAENVTIATMLPTGGRKGWVEYENFDGIYPKKNAIVGDANGFIYIKIFPFTYDPTTRNLYFTKDFKVQVSTKRKTPPAPQNPISAQNPITRVLS